MDFILVETHFSMHSSNREINFASKYVTNLLQTGNKQIKDARLETFSHALENQLCKYYHQHWFPEKPCKGSGFRCLRIHHKVDPLIVRAGQDSGFSEKDLRELLPREFTLWIDPQEVSCRFGENGSICVLYDGRKKELSTETNVYQCINYSNEHGMSFTHHQHENFAWSPYRENRHPVLKEMFSNTFNYGCPESSLENFQMDDFNDYASS